MTKVLDEIRWLAQDQHGAFTTGQAAEVGADGGWLLRARRDRVIDTLRRGAFAVLDLVDEWTPMAATQLLVPRSVASHTAAGKLHGYDGIDAYRMDVIVPPNVNLRGPWVHRRADLVVPEITIADNLRVTDEIRTLLELGAVLAPKDLERAIESWRRRPGRQLAALVERAALLARPGRSGPHQVLAVVELLPETPTESDVETVYWQVLRDHGVDLPVRQHPVGPYRLDNAYPDERVFVELDGYSTHGTYEAFVKDRRRQNAIVLNGWVPLRFSNADVRAFPRRTAMETAAMLRRRRADLMVVARV